MKYETPIVELIELLPRDVFMIASLPDGDNGNEWEDDNENGDGF